MPTISELKEKSGAKLYASLLGKSTIPSDSSEYKMIEDVTRCLIENGFGVIHGGYAGGAMAAVSDTANKVIKEKNLHACWNIGVPQSDHDGLWDRVVEAEFTDVAEDIFQRLKVVTSGDIAIVCPLGGDGTELEEVIVFHENIVRTGLMKYGRESKKITPLIFLQTEDGTNWKKIIEIKMSLLDTSVKNPSEYPWMHFINSLNEFEKLLKELKNDLLK